MAGNVLTICETVKRAKAENIPVSEYALRKWVKTGAIYSRKSGNRCLLYWPTVRAYITGEGESIAR